MLVRGASRPETKPQETVTQRLERLRLEHRRHVRNTEGTSSQSSTRRLVTVGPSLPDDTTVNAIPGVDNWNNDGTQVARRPRTTHPPPLNAGVNNPPAQIPVPVHGPPPPRSWVIPSARTSRVAPSRRRTTASSPSTAAHPKVARKAAPTMTVIERLKLQEEEVLTNAYSEEYWFRSASDTRWSAWREEALRIVFSYSAGSSEAGKQVLEESPFTTFDVPGEGSRMPTLFETVLRFIFASSPMENSASQSADEDSDLDWVDIIEALPVHIQKRVLRYAAARNPLSRNQLQRIYLGTREEDEDSLMVTDPNAPVEIILSGRKVEPKVLEDLLKAGTTQDSQSTTPSILQSIVFFQTPFLQKRLLTTFPKTLTTLGLIALPPPKGMLLERSTTKSTPGSGSDLDSLPYHCSCPWCTTHPTTVPSTSQTRTRPFSSTPPSTSLASSAPHISPALVSQLVELPSLLPSLVILDVSYNPWMTLDASLHCSHAGKGCLCRTRKAEHAGVGIFGKWDLRLWGRMKILGMRGCFEHLPIGRPTDVDDMEALVPFMETGLVPEPTIHCACGVPAGSRAAWRGRDALLQSWEKTMYAVGRKIEVLWREHECRCGVQVSTSSL